jgi:hypothetical protein
MKITCGTCGKIAKFNIVYMLVKAHGSALQNGYRCQEHMLKFVNQQLNKETAKDHIIIVSVNKIKGRYNV